MFPLLILAGVAITLYLTQYLLTTLRHRRLSKQWQTLPPFRRQHQLPLSIDFLREMQTADKENDLPTYIYQTHRKLAPHRTWVNSILGADCIITSEPEVIKAILATQFKDFELGPLRKGSFSPIFANGIFSDDGARWEHSRALIRPQFAREQIADLTALERHVQNLMAAITTNVGTDGWTALTDLQPLFFRQTLDSSTEFLFGQSADSQLAALREASSGAGGGGLEWDKFGPAWDEATMEVSKRFRLNNMYWLHNTKAMREACAEVHRFADHFVQLALNPPVDSKTPESGHKPYVFLTELAKSTRDPIELRDQLLNVLLAGRDTTAGLLGFVFYQLAQHPELYAKLRSTVLEHFGTYKDPKNMDFPGLKACAYLQHTLLETMRLHPSVPFNSRRATRDTTIPLGGGADQKSPIFVPKGMEVNYAVHVMHRRPDLWGADSLAFNPDRWQGRKTGWEFLPFNGGPRICLGQQFAITTAGYTVARLVQRFEEVSDLVGHREAEGIVTTNGVDREGDYAKYSYTVTGAPLHMRVRLREGRGE